jgi:hypothetical protein
MNSGRISTDLPPEVALDMLGITVWLDGDDVEITGFVDAEYEGIATKSS